MVAESITSGYVAVAVGWLVGLALLYYTRLAQCSVIGTKLLASGAIFAIFTSAFQVFSDALTVTGQESAGTALSNAGLWVGGTISWIFCLVGTMFLAVGIISSKWK